MASDKQYIVDFLFEVGILSKTPRTGFHFLGSGTQSVSEHINRTVYIGYVLASLNTKADMGKVLKLCLFHDLAEARTTDLNYVHQKYTHTNDQKAIDELTNGLIFGKDIANAIKEFKERTTLEGKLAKDADVLEWVLSLKEQFDTGSTRAEKWMQIAVKRLQTKHAKEIGEIIMKTKSDHWWFAEQDDDWWVTRYKMDKKTKK